jgi:hypothetical protein
MLRQLRPGLRRRLRRAGLPSLHGADIVAVAARACRSRCVSSAVPASPLLPPPPSAAAAGASASTRSVPPPLSASASHSVSPSSSDAIRASFLSYFREHDHVEVPSSLLVPANDPTLLFTNAGMVQFKDKFFNPDREFRNMGAFSRACSVQRCLRAGGKHNGAQLASCPRQRVVCVATALLFLRVVGVSE